MELTNDQRDGLNTALNEAAWLGIDVDPGAARAAVAVEVLTLPPAGPPPDDTTRSLLLSGVSRVAASLRNGLWNDADASVERLSLTDLDAAVTGFGGCPIYGWEFIDPPSDSWAGWRDRLSLDAHLSTEPAPHVLELFQEGGGSAGPRHLDLRVWFSTLRVTHRTGEEIPLQELAIVAPVARVLLRVSGRRILAKKLPLLLADPASIAGSKWNTGGDLTRMSPEIVDLMRDEMSAVEPTRLGNPVTV